MDYKIEEISKKTKSIEYNEIIDYVDNKLIDKINNYETKEDLLFNNILEKQLNYEENYTKKELEMIADYYKISKRKKNKAILTQDIVLFETDPTNFEITEKRKLMWFYFNEIKNDRYFRKFIIYK
tara:strand:- start:20157 stop:20531 length:375 start_codon:yes stop_codon:yes gene_type:complete